MRSSNLPTYWAGINSDLTAEFDKQGNIVKVDISYPRDFVKQQLAYSAMYPAISLSNRPANARAGLGDF